MCFQVHLPTWDKDEGALEAGPQQPVGVAQGWYLGERSEEIIGAENPKSDRIEAWPRWSKDRLWVIIQKAELVLGSSKLRATDIIFVQKTKTIFGMKAGAS